MRLRLFTFLMMFLATMSGAVWGQDRGSYETPLDIGGFNSVLEIDDSETWYIKTSSTNYSGIKIESGGVGNHNKPTIYLMGVELSAGGSAIIIENYADPTFVLVGENTITSDGYDAAIKIGNALDCSLTIAKESTGLLTIKVSSDDYAIGNKNLAGSLTVNGGTIITQGKLGDFYTHAYRMDGYGVVIANGIEYNDHNKLLSNGILFEGSIEGKMYGDVTLNSPLDLTDNDQTATLDLQGGTLTIGENGELKADQGDIRNGKISGVRVAYEANRITDCQSTIGTLPVDNNFYPTSGEISLAGALTCNAQSDATTGKHQFLGWVYGDQVYEAGTKLTLSESAKTYTVDGSGNITEGEAVKLQGAWAVEELSLTINNNKAMEERTLAATPNIVSYENVTEGLPAGISFSNGTFSGTATLSDSDFGDAEKKEYTVTIPITAKGTSGKSAMVKIIVNKTLPDLSTAIVTINTTTDYIYNGVKKEAITVTVNDSPLREGVHYTATYKYKKNESAEEVEVSEIKEAGTYTLTKIEAREDMAQNSKESELPNTVITVAPRTLYATISNLIKKVGEGIDAPSEDNISITDNTGDENDYFIAAHSSATVTYSGIFSGSTDKVGEYVLSLGSVAIEKITVSETDVTHNYKLGTVTPGKLTVIQEGTEEYPIDPGTPGSEDEVIIRVKDWEVENRAYQHIYNGDDLTETLKSSLEAKQIMEDGSVDWYSIPETAVTEIKVISYEVNSAAGTADIVKNAGLYSLQITLDAIEAEGLLYKGVISPLLVRIIPRELSINFFLDGLTEEYIGKTIDMANGELLWEYVDVENVGLVDKETPIFSGYIRIADTENDEGKYDVYYKISIEDNEDSGFLKSNYNSTVSIDDVVITLGAEDETQLPGEGIEIVEESTGGSGSIITQRHQLYLADKDFDKGTIYDEEGLELFSRHNKKYAKTGSSFTIWYEHNGVANDGEYRIFIRRGRSGSWTELKIDTVSDYYQIRNVQTDIYVKIYGLNGYPVANEEISATEARAYAQANKIVVITPEPTDVQIISMAGAVVATDKVTGQREFGNLTAGIYIVRMGETVVKLQVRN